DLMTLLDAVIAGGCRMVQLRDKSAPSGHLVPVAERLQARCRQAGVTFIVNDRVDLAVAIGADGVHLGQDDLPPRLARPLLSPGMILGRSTHTLVQATRARDEAVDYVAVGSMFETATKPDFELAGPDLLRRIRPLTPLPLVGIGGITHANVGDVIRAGADGVAVISAVCGAPDPAAATRRLLAAIREARDLTRTPRL